tara:strand:+ start:3624 stop:4346 length:723 start_codon:yes stop_codon:yes gene_type:complete
MKLRPVLFEFDVPNLRSARQDETWKTVATILEKGILDKEPIKKYINETALQRHLEFHECGERDLFMNCQGNSAVSKMLAVVLGKESHRQSGQDEVFTLNGIDQTVKHYGFRVECLPNSLLRPAMDGKTYPNALYKKKFGNTVNDIKTIDGEIKRDGKLFGWLSHKYCLGRGGGQDNVFQEEKRWLSWGRDISIRKDLIYIALIDTDLEVEYNKLQEEFDNPTGNIWVVNHIELQKRLINY